MKIVFLGSDEFAVPSLEAVARAHTVAAVVAPPDRPAQRGQKLRPSPVKLRAEKLGLPLLQPQKIVEILPHLSSLSPEAIVVVAYGQILPREILRLPPRGCINVHASLLPRWRGAAPVAHAILHGDPHTGVTTMRMDEGLDTGPILLQRKERICPDDTTASVEARLAKMGAELLLETLAKEISPRPQDPAQATHAPKLKKQDGCIDWTLSAEQIDRRIRAFNPWPGAATFLNGMRLRIWRAQILSECGPAGAILRADEKGILVATGQGSLLLTEVQREGGRRMSAAEFLRGFRRTVGRRLG